MARKKQTSADRYFSLLKFNPADLRSFVGQYVINIRLVILIILGLLTFGISGFVSLPRRLNPEIDIPIVFVGTVLPGAGPEDVESLVTEPLENSIQGVEHIDRISSVSNDSFSAISVEFETGIDPNEARDEVQSAVDSMSASLPEDAATPNVTALDFEDVPVWTFAIETDQDIASLSRFADVLIERIEDIPTVNSVIVSGLDEQEIFILVEPEKLSQYGISPFQLSQAIAAETNSFPGGIVTTGAYEFSVAIDPLITSLDDMRSLVITIDGEPYHLSDIATVVERPAPGQSASYIAERDGGIERTVSFSVFKLAAADIDDSASRIRAVVEQTVEEYDGRYEVASIMDVGREIEMQFTDLISNMSATIGLVFLTLLLFLGLRQAAIASLAIPLSFLGVFGLMNVTGYSINFLSMFSLILSLGLLVDTAIVIISAMTNYYETGKFTPAQTGILVWKDFITPLASSLATTVWAFVPLLLATGIIGSFIRTIPVVVTYALIASFLVSMLITLPFMVVFLKFSIPRRARLFFEGVLLGLIALVFYNVFHDSYLVVPIMLLAAGATWYFARNRDHILKQASQSIDKRSLAGRVRSGAVRLFSEGIISPRGLTMRYHKIINRILAQKASRRLVVIMVTVLFIFSVFLAGSGLVQNTFFPSTDEDQVYISVELPSGTTVEQTNQEALTLLEQIQDTEDVQFVISEIGLGVDTSSVSSTSRSNIIRFSLILDEDRSRSSVRIAESLREEFRGYNRGDLSVVEISGGPPVGADVELKLLGPDLSVLSQKADEAVAYLSEQPGIISAEKSIKPGAAKLSFVPDRQKLADAGLSVSEIGIWMRTYLSGFELDTVSITNTDDQRVVFRMSTENMTPESLAALRIPSSQGDMVPLLSLGTFELRENPTQITREDDQRTIVVSADVAEGYNSVEIGSQMGEFAENSLDLPNGYTWSTGGVNEENTESVNSIIQAMALAFVLILATMVIQFRSYRKALIVLLVIPLALSGVFIIFALTGVPLSFPALIGLLALFGIVVNNSIMIVEKVNQNLEIGMKFDEAVAEGSSSRLEPILFSSLTTIIGLIPITVTDPLWRGLGGAIISGLTFSGAIALFFIPVVYYMMFAGEYKKH